MSLKEKDKRTRLLHDKPDNLKLRAFNLSLVIMFLLQLLLPFGAYAGASSTDNDSIEPSAIETQLENSEESTQDIESPRSNGSSLETPVEEIEEANEPDTPSTPTPEEKEEAPENIVEEPVNKPEENTNEQPPPEAPKAPETSEEPEVPKVKEEAELGETAEEEVESLSNENGVPGVLDGYSGIPHLMKLFDYSSIHNLNKTQFSSFDVGLTSDTGLSPGEVRTTKTATPVSGMVNTWDIEVLIEGMDVQKTSDIVLVIDRSGSMSGNRMTNAKNAAKNFVETLIPTSGGGNTRIAVVSFSDSASTNSNLDSIRSHKITQINNLSASGGTHTQAAIRHAKEILDGSGQRDYKHIVLLSDGVPTYSYGFNSNTTRNGGLIDSSSTIRYQTGSSNVDTFSNRHYRTGKNYSAGAFSSTTVGNGYAPNNYDGAMHYSSSSNDTYGSWPNNRRVFYDHGNSTINESTFSKNAGYMVWTVALDPSTDGQQIIGEIASPNRAYTASPSDLNAIFAEIAGSINSAARDMVVTDPMGVGFQIPANQISNITVSQGTVNYNQSTKTISWNAGNLNRPSGSNVKSATLKYRVEINDDILTLPGAKTNDHQLFKTNGTTTLNYTDSDSTSKSKEFISPEVDPVLLKVKKILKDRNGNVITNDSRRFNVNINKATPNGYNHTESLVPGADYVWLTTLRHEGAHNVLETAITGTGETRLSEYDISYLINGVSAASFLVNHINGKPRGDIAIEVINKELFGDATPDDPLIRVSKTFSGLTQTQIDSLTDFKITITSQSDSTKTQDLFLATAVRIVEANGDITYKWELEGWPAGTYSVSETGEDLGGYDVIIENDGTVTTVAATVNWTTNLWKKPNTQVNNDLRVNGIPPNIVATKLSSSSGVFVWTETRLSASQRLAIVNALSGWTELGLTMENGYWFSGEDIEGEHFYFRGYRIQYDLDTGNLHIPQSNQWALIVSGKYNFEGGDPADIAVKNTYNMNTIDFEFEKVNEVGNPLTGAVFKLERIKEDNTRTEIPNVGTDPIFKYEDLIAGSYVLTEISAPENYVTPEDNTWLFHVVWNDTTKQMEINFEIGDEVDDEIANYPKGMLPDTGGPGNTHLIIISMVAFTLFMTLGVWRFKRDEVNHDG